MIPITKAEKEKLVKVFPPDKPPYYRFPRTMKHDSKRHHYFCTESEELMRIIADTNIRAEERVKEYDRRNELRKIRQKACGDDSDGGSRTS